MYLTNYLLEQGYRVVGLVRRTSLPTQTRLRTLRGSPNLHLIHGDITDVSSIQKAVREFQPDEFYNLAAQSHVAMSWEYPLTTADITGVGVLNCLEAIRQEKPDCKFYQAGSSEQFGNSVDNHTIVCGTDIHDFRYTLTEPTKENPFVRPMLTENSPMEPESPYAAAKVFGYNITQVYRRSFDMFATCGILFNHESPVRGEEFVTRKITSNLARVKWGLQEYVELGNMDACRDWGFAGDYVRAMHAMLQHDEPDDFVIATGKTYSVKRFFNECCEWFDLNPEEVYKINPKYMRPKDVEVLLGDSTKAQEVLGWKPECGFEELVSKMCQYDYHLQSPDPSYSRKADEFLF
jgi:GDPmannose 4,6-dehydratase